MKIIKILTLFIVLGAYSGLMTSCHSHDGEHTHEHSHDTHAEEAGEHDHSEGGAHGEGAAFTSAYVCPMHCETSGSDKAGECPVCGMDYVTLADHTKDGHTH